MIECRPSAASSNHTSNRTLLLAQEKPNWSWCSYNRSINECNSIFSLLRAIQAPHFSCATIIYSIRICSEWFIIVLLVIQYGSLLRNGKECGLLFFLMHCRHKKGGFKYKSEWVVMIIEKKFIYEMCVCFRWKWNERTPIWFRYMLIWLKLSLRPHYLPFFYSFNHSVDNLSVGEHSLEKQNTKFNAWNPYEFTWNAHKC